MILVLYLHTGWFSPLNGVGFTVCWPLQVRPVGTPIGLDNVKFVNFRTKQHNNINRYDRYVIHTPDGATAYVQPARCCTALKIVNKIEDCVKLRFDSIRRCKLGASRLQGHWSLLITVWSAGGASVRAAPGTLYPVPCVGGGAKDVGAADGRRISTLRMPKTHGPRRAAHL